MSIFVTTCITFTSGNSIERDMNVGISDGEITLGDIARHFWPHVMGIMTCSSIQIYDEELEGYVDALNPDELTVGPKSNIRIDFVVSDALSVIRPPTSFLFCGTPRGSALVVGQSIRRSEQALKTVDLTKKAAATLGSNLDRKSVVDDAENQIQQPKSRKRRRRRSNRSTSPKPKPEKDSVKRPSPEIDPQKSNESTKSEICESEVLELFPLSYGDYISSEEQEESKEGPELKSEQKLEKSHSPSRFPRDENSPKESIEKLQ